MLDVLGLKCKRQFLSEESNVSGMQDVCDRPRLIVVLAVRFFQKNQTFVYSCAFSCLAPTKLSLFRKQDLFFLAGVRTPHIYAVATNPETAEYDANDELAELGAGYSGGVALFAGSNAWGRGNPCEVTQAADCGEGLEVAEEDVGKD